jgi:O-antigen ligase
MGRWAREHPRIRVHLWTLIGALPFVHPHYTAIMSFGARPGDTFGIEVALIDGLALALLVAAKPAGRRLPYRGALALYFLVAVLSVTQARWTLVSAGYVWKLGRMYLLFLAVWRSGCDDERVPWAILRGMTYGIVYEGVLAVWQHYGLGLMQASGSFTHQNTLGILMNLVVMVPIARILAGPTPLVTKLAPVAAVLVGLFTVSRGTLLFLGLGSALVYLGSAYRELTPRKARIGLAGLLVVAAIVPIALRTIEYRAPEERAGSMQVRGQLETAASSMLKDHPLGVGAGHYAVELLLGGYGVRAGVHWGMRTAIVHNVYWLTAAEMGYLGVVALLVLFAAPLRKALRHGLHRGRERQRDVLLGLGVGLAVFDVHSMFEWNWRLTEVSYVFFMSAAMVPVLARQLAVRRSARRARAAAASAARTQHGPAVAATHPIQPAFPGGGGRP